MRPAAFFERLRHGHKGAPASSSIERAPPRSAWAAAAAAAKGGVEDGASAGGTGDKSIELQPLRTEPREAPRSNVRPLDQGEEAALHFDQGMSLLRGGREEEALKEWETALALDPHNRVYDFIVRRLRKRRTAEKAG